MKKLILFAVAMVALATSTQAQSEKQTLKDERRRIAQGIRSGQITKAEALLLRKQARTVRRTKALAAADGVITPREGRAIVKEDRTLDRSIYRSKHNKRKKN